MARTSGRLLRGKTASGSMHRVQHLDNGCQCYKNARNLKIDQLTINNLSSPLAPAATQRLASSLMASNRTAVEGRAPSKMIAFWCFQSSQAVRMVIEAKPLRRLGGDCCMASDHHWKKQVVPSGGVEVHRLQERISCHVILEKTHPTRRCCKVSSSWEQRTHSGSCCNPREARRSAVQHRFYEAAVWPCSGTDGPLKPS